MRLEPRVEYAAPRSPAEALLARICAEVLGVERIGVYDRFFSIGGDSIAAIQVASRASREGLQLTPRQLFQHQTIAELATVLGEASTSRTTEQGSVTGEVPLTPVQRWFFELQVEDVHHWNQALLFETREQISPTLLETAMDILLTHHDALRTRFVPGGSGWRQLLEEPGAPVPLTHVDLSALSEPGRARALRAAIADAQSSLDLLQGSLLRGVLFTRDGGAPAQILIVVHHLVVDGVSWRILLEDLATLYEQLSRGEVGALPPKTSSFKDWAERLVRFAREDFLEPELAYWLEAPWEGAAPLPIDHPGIDNSEASEDSISVALGAEETRALLQRAPEVFRASIDELLLAALARTLARWTGGSSILVDLEGHGREDLFEELDLSRTVGWFTAMYPIVLDLSRAFRLEDAVRSVKEQVRSIPRRGVVFGIARHLEGDSPVARNLRALPRPEIQLNYLGQFDQAMPGGLPFRLSPEPSGPDRSPRGARPHLLEVNGKVGGGRLRLDWLYSRNLHHRSTIERVAQDFLEELRALVDPDQMPAGETLLPSDFPLASFDQEDLSHLASLLNRIDGLEEGEIE
jgi:fengycin family lipopeptide synthetase B